MELIHQISTRIIALLNHFDVSTLVLENLKWATHSSKSKSGYFLAQWQIHWFYSQVQNMLVNQAKLCGIRVEFVNPKDSSKICWKCMKMGKRDGKIFNCTSNQCSRYQLDSDLNAARNLIIRSKKYKRLLSRLWSLLLYANWDGFPFSQPRWNKMYKLVHDYKALNERLHYLSLSLH